MRISPGDIRALTVFRALVDHAGFMGAQLALGMSQSTVSFHLKSLEERLGFELCRRGRRGFELTERGRAVYDASKPLAASLSSFEGALGALRHQLVGTLRVGVVDNTITDENLSLSVVIGNCMRRSPEVEILLTVAAPETLFVELANGGVDIVVAPQVDAVAGFEQVVFHEELHSLYCGRSHGLFGTKPSIAEAEASNFVVRPYARSRELVHFPNARIRALASNMEAQAAFILSGELIGYLPEHFARHWVERDLMRPILSPDTRIASLFVVATNGSADQSPLQRLFQRELLQQGSMRGEAN
ncbi:LysR family transcriptional regulator [Aminobacter anthyllidis]|uniref:LysR family transcriptional regulator n=1 Tax=Aminobacter anthyllidis TaxID=1035067 RepID=A0A9X1D6L1_9HYPH|nr:LysR family transcriptional regulator [Aminobacter anthyllidis]MBT1157171.1 LysR family transcriptional regulator [Aminobacter anthyllidis]